MPPPRATPSAPFDSAATAARSHAAYWLRLARSAADLRAVQALRFEVFNLELDEGLAQSYDTGLDADAFDAHCDHLLVQDTDGAVVGTYRLQTGLRAAQNLGYYSAREFDFSPFEPQRGQILELGRACIAQRHRSFAVLNLLWKGIAAYAREQGARYLIGCSSLTSSQDPATGAAAWRVLAAHRAPPAWWTTPLPAWACPLDVPAAALHSPAPATPPAPVHIPRLLSAYLALGAAVCGPPAIDREFRTIDFLTWLDIESPAVQAMQQRGRFVG